ncbi:MAG: PhaM family polyhydroxyalkanoate granule multifunctional regulatory protein [Rubrivivax sp.]
MASAADFAKFVPGFDFLQGLMRGAGQMLPDMGKWVAPTLDPEELGQRIEQLKTVQLWLEQNARMLGATIQALEVQRMTLATLKSMNVPVADLGQVLQARVPEPAPARAAAQQAAPFGTASRASAPAGQEGANPRAGGRAARARGAKAAAAGSTRDPTGAGTPMVDPMQWWGALTQQFTQLAAQAMKEGPVEAARSAAGQIAGAATRAAGGTAGAAPAGAEKPAAGSAAGRRAPRTRRPRQT